ncbi:MAG TPA: MarR family winged helix-turn-helix transcriptional regulator [Solirubrobacteraceae bacterium]|nr:MarR family winged helix-turn-helix transcriptional regulator [Solirubrobacteraceae bacterium]
MSPHPVRAPIGLQLTRASRVVSRAFDDALSDAGGSLPVWLVLLNLKTRRVANQRELAEAVGVREATLTHHLNGMEREGLLTRRRDASNRRIHVVELTEAGEGLFTRLRDAALSFDRRLRRGLTPGDLDALDGALERLAGNVSPRQEGAAPRPLSLPPAGEPRRGSHGSG